MASPSSTVAEVTIVPQARQPSSPSPLERDSPLHPTPLDQPSRLQSPPTQPGSPSPRQSTIFIQPLTPSPRHSPSPPIPSERLTPISRRLDFASTRASPSTPGSHHRPRFYAVWSGLRPGVYSSWPEANAAKGPAASARSKGFDTREEAEAHLRVCSRPRRSSKPKFYAVAIGKRPGIYTRWSDAEKAIGQQGIGRFVKYKSWETREEAVEWMGTYGVVASDVTVGDEAQRKVQVTGDEFGEEADEDEDMDLARMLDGLTMEGDVWKDWTGPALITNAPRTPMLLSLIRNELHCPSLTTVLVSIAYIRTKAITYLHSTLAAVSSRLSAGTGSSAPAIFVLTTSQFGRSDEAALFELSRIPGLALGVFAPEWPVFHAKGWLFDRDEGESVVVVGSSNLSGSALCEGVEMNVRLKAKRTLVRGGTTVELESIEKQVVEKAEELGKAGEKAQQASEPVEIDQTKVEETKERPHKESMAEEPNLAQFNEADSAAAHPEDTSSKEEPQDKAKVIPKKKPQPTKTVETSEDLSVAGEVVSTFRKEFWRIWNSDSVWLYDGCDDHRKRFSDALSAGDRRAWESETPAATPLR